MLYGSVSSFCCTLVAVVAAGSIALDSTSDSSTAESVEEARPDRAVDLGALLDHRYGSVVALVAGDTRLVAHRAVLTARSPVFQRILQDIAIGEVAVPDVEGPVLRQLVAYLYTLQVPQLPAMAPQLLAAADQYGLPALKADCERQVAERLSVETAASAAVVAIRHSSNTLRKAAVAYIRAHIFQVMATQGWADAINSQPRAMAEVARLLSESPAETSSSAPAESGSSPYHATQPHSDYSVHQTPTAAATTVIAQTITQPDDDNISPLHSSAPAASGSSPYHATQPHSDYSVHQTPTAAATTVVAQTITQPDDDNISPLRQLSTEEKNRRLVEAAKQGALGELEALLAAGADAAARDGGMWSALHWAAYGGHEEAARRLLAAGAPVDASDNTWQWTPLHAAAGGGRAAAVRLLLAAGADHGARSVTGNTPLHLAAVWGHREAAAALLEGGADKAARDDKGITPLESARRKNRQQVEELLLQGS